MCERPPKALLQAAIDAGLLSLQHKVLNCSAARPLLLDLELLQVLRARESSAALAKLLDGAQRYASPFCMHRTALYIHA
jgi:hypothetical protein